MRHGVVVRVKTGHSKRGGSMGRWLLAGGLMLCTWTAELSGQARTITGRVADSLTAAGLPGVRVALKNTTARAFTKADGTFAIEAPPEDVVLATQFIGYTKREVPVAAEPADATRSLVR